MKKHLLKLMGILAISASAYAIAPDMIGPPVTEGFQEKGSSTEVRVTANVVAGVAVNEASPIDFGNLVRGPKVYQNQERINAITPGLVTFRADKGANGDQTRADISAYLNTNKINLDWKNANGSSGSGTQNTLKKVRIEGLGVGSGQATNIALVDGQAKKQLNAWFYAYDKETNLNTEDYSADENDGNLGKNQRLGSYLGTVTVHANIK